MMKHTQNRTLRASAVSFAIAGMLMAGSVSAGKIDNLNNDLAKPGACVALDNPATKEDESLLSPAACIGAWNLDNVDVKLVKIDTGAESDFFDELTGLYTAMTYGDSFVSIIKDTANNVMARLSGKVWPVGEPTGIKAVNNDLDVKEGKPQNCIINTAYLGANLDDMSTTNDVDAYLDSTTPKPVLCSSPFQSHKRFKIAMQPATVAGVTATIGGANVGNPIDLVFNVTDEGSTALRPYQVFSKIDNYTGVRLKGYKIEVGTGTGTNFYPASVAVPSGRPAITDRLQISLGVNEALIDKDNDPATAGVVGDIFDGDGLATFSHGLFGAPDKHFTVNGFFDERTAGFEVKQKCATEAACLMGNDPVTGVMIDWSDTIYSDAILPSNYTTFFGDWLPSIWQPKGIFFDDDNIPTTDPVLVAWWNGSAWIKNYNSVFAQATATELATWGSNKSCGPTQAEYSCYAVDDIEDVLNLGINYIVKVGDGIGPNFTVRIIPIVADTQVAPAWTVAGAEAPPLVVDPTVVPPPTPAPIVPPSGGGGGCSTATGDTPFDPVLPILAALGLAGLGVRRLRRQ